MILIDTALQRRVIERRPIRVAIIGSGIMGQGIINQIIRYSPGIQIMAVYNRTISKTISFFKSMKYENYAIAENSKNMENILSRGQIALTSDIELICGANHIDLLIEVTGTIDFAADFMMKAFGNKKHVLSFNAELEATLGPILKYKAAEAGVMYSLAEGDQPGVTMNLYRQVKSMGFTPLLCGNIKGLQDRYRNPATQKNFAAQWDMTPEMVTSFADGTKISFEQACIANATGMKVATRGMLGYTTDKHVDEIKDLYDLDLLKEKGGIVEYVVGARPGPGVYIYATIGDEFSKKYLRYVKMGDGPLYSFYIPYHLLFFEIANSISRMIDFKDDILSAKNGLEVHIITAAKTALRAGESIDGLGGFKTYGLCENAEIVNKESLLHMGLANGCKVLKDLAKDQVITFEDVELPKGRLIDKLWKEQNKLFS